MRGSLRVRAGRGRGVGQAGVREGASPRRPRATSGCASILRWSSGGAGASRPPSPTPPTRWSRRSPARPPPCLGSTAPLEGVTYGSDMRLLVNVGGMPDGALRPRGRPRLPPAGRVGRRRRGRPCRADADRRRHAILRCRQRRRRCGSEAREHACATGIVLRHTRAGGRRGRPGRCSTRRRPPEPASRAAASSRSRPACRDPRIDARPRNTWVVDAPGGEPRRVRLRLLGSSRRRARASPSCTPTTAAAAWATPCSTRSRRRAAELAAAAPADVDAAPSRLVRRDQGRGVARSLLEHGFRAVRRVVSDAARPRRRPAAAGAAAGRHRGAQIRRSAATRPSSTRPSEEAFAEHFLYEPSTLDQWRAHTLEHPRFDPSLWLVAWDGRGGGGGGADASRTRTRPTSTRSPCAARWRGRGLGLALLTRAFGLAHVRGLRKVRLGVDAQNPTGALAVYLKAGMHVERREEVYAKDL